MLKSPFHEPSKRSRKISTSIISAAIRRIQEVNAVRRLITPLLKMLKDIAFHHYGKSDCHGNEVHKQQAVLTQCIYLACVLIGDQNIIG